MKMKVQIEVSARHIHLNTADCQTLFGTCELQKKNNLSEKGEFACLEQVEVVGPERRLQKVRVLGPLRADSQLEISRTDSYYLGIDAPLRLSGEGGGEKIKIVGPKGNIIKDIAIVAKRHFHLKPNTARRLGLKDDDEIAVKIGGDRSVVFDSIIVRISEGFADNIHLDTDEANAAGISGQGIGELITRP